MTDERLIIQRFAAIIDRLEGTRNRAEVFIELKRVEKWKKGGPSLGQLLSRPPPKPLVLDKFARITKVAKPGFVHPALAEWDALFSETTAPGSDLVVRESAKIMEDSPWDYYSKELVLPPFNLGPQDIMRAISKRLNPKEGFHDSFSTMYWAQQSQYKAICTLGFRKYLEEYWNAYQQGGDHAITHS
jgi:hypothetical protein